MRLLRRATASTAAGAHLLAPKRETYDKRKERQRATGRTECRATAQKVCLIHTKRSHNGCNKEQRHHNPMGNGAATFSFFGLLEKHMRKGGIMRNIGYPMPDIEKKQLGRYAGVHEDIITMALRVHTVEHCI